MTGICWMGGKSSGVLLWFRTRKLLGINHLIVCWSGLSSHHSAVFDVTNRIRFVWGTLAADQTSTNRSTPTALYNGFLYKPVVRLKHSLTERKSKMHSKQFWSPVTLSTFTLPKGMSSNTGLQIVQKLKLLIYVLLLVLMNTRSPTETALLCREPALDSATVRQLLPNSLRVKTQFWSFI